MLAVGIWEKPAAAVVVMCCRWSVGALIHQHLGAGRSVVNVGAGARSYEPADRCVLAVEPSAAMRARRSFTAAVPAIDAAAEALPFDDASIDAAMAIFTVHQWADPARGLAELRRVTRGPVVVMTLDIETPSGFWLGEYLPERLAAEQNRFPPAHRDSDGPGWAYRGDPGTDTPGLRRRLPRGLLRATGSAARPRRPRRPVGVAVHLRHRGQRRLRRLAGDLANGSWDARHGHLRHQLSYTGPLALVTAEP